MQANELFRYLSKVSKFCSVHTWITPTRSYILRGGQLVHCRVEGCLQASSHCIEAGYFAKSSVSVLNHE
jgi:hypothetical protein